MLRYTYHADNTTFTEPMKAYVEKTFDVLHKYVKADTNVRVVTKLYKNKTVKVEATIKDTHAEVKDVEFYRAVDFLVKKLEGQFRKEKTKQLKYNHDTIRVPDLEIDEEDTF